MKAGFFDSVFFLLFHSSAAANAVLLSLSLKKEKEKQKRERSLLLCFPFLSPHESASQHLCLGQLS